MIKAPDLIGWESFQPGNSNKKAVKDKSPTALTLSNI